MTRGVLLLAATLAAGAVRAQPAAEPPGVPPGEASIRGRVVHAADGSPAAGVETVLYALPAQAPPGLRRTTTDAEGRFAFDGVDGDPAGTYLVGARYQDVSYPGARIQFSAEETVREALVRVHEVTGEPGDAAIRELHVRLDWLGDRLEIEENLVVENPGARTVFLPAAKRAGRKPAIALALPAGASGLTGPLGLLPDGVGQVGGALQWYGPLIPGRNELGYRYRLPAREGTLRLARALPAAPIRVTLLAPASGPKLEAPGLTEGESTVAEGRGFRVLTGELSQRLALELTVPPARHDASAVSLAEVRIVGELDAAAFVAREEHVIQVSGDGPVLAPGQEALLAIPLPVGASELRFGAPQSGTRLAALPDGSGIAVTGPLAPGETVLEVRYRMPADGGPFALSRRFAARVPLLSVYLADTGRLRVASDRLHRRRPATTPDRTYLHLEAFELVPGEEVSFRVEPLPARRELPRAAALAGLALATALAALSLGGPLRPAAGEADAEAPEAESAAAREREALTAALRDLEHDFETGKLDPADYAPLRNELRGRVLRLLEAERSAAARPPAPAAPAPPACPACGRAAAAGDRFCAGCGTRLA
jgi:hypothetical protein